MESIACNLCRHQSATHWLTSVDRVSGEGFDIVQCSRCGLRYTSPRPTADELAAYYPEPAAPSRLARILRRWLRERRARWCAAGLLPGRALEIGCGDGWMLETLWRMGWRVVGTERSRQSAAHALSLGLDVCVGELAGCGFAPQSFDLVILWHALEHLHDPLSTLSEVRLLMRPTGRLVVAVPNAASWQARVAGRCWFHLDLPRHLYHFDSQTLAAMLGRAGFRIQAWSFSSLAYEWRGWWELLSGWGRSTWSAGALASLSAPLLLAFSAVAALREAGAAMSVRASTGPQTAPVG
ncbi:MAG: methyltransferase domain-containing protein [Anaerolineae bacterium]